jgi:hypothetical protein
MVADSLKYSLMALMVPGRCVSTSSISLSMWAMASEMQMASTFQSVSPSSMRARTPNTFTATISPVRSCRAPMSSTSMGSLSPGHPVSLGMKLGSSHVCGRKP